MAHESLVVSFEDADPGQVKKLGAKGAKLVEDFLHIRETFPGMEDAIAVPDGFILTTDLWRRYHEAGGRLTDELLSEVLPALKALEHRTGQHFGDMSGRMPLMVAVRGGAPVSLPGALSTALNVGLNDEIVATLIASGENPGFVLTTFLTAIRMYGEVVFNLDYDPFYRIIKEAGDEGAIAVPQLRDLIGDFKGVLEAVHHPRFSAGFASDPIQQLRNTIEGVMASWMSPIAVEARRSRRSIEGGISEDMGTAVIVQKMVFGNRDDLSCLSGVLFTRDQRTGANFPIIEWSPKVQCDKIVSGKLRKQLFHAPDLKERFPEIYERLLIVRDRFEARARRPLDIEFTVEGNKLYLLQRRPMRMTPNATVRAMWDFVDEGKTNIQLASMIINKAMEQPEKVLQEGATGYQVLARGEPITDSADGGILVFGTEAALQLVEEGKDVVLLRKSPYGENDVAVNHPRVRGILRYDGHTTGHEAVSAVAYCKPYLINVVGEDGEPLVLTQGEQIVLNPASLVTQYIGKRVFVDCERGFLGYTEAPTLLEDRKRKKKLYVDWEFLRDQFDAAGYDQHDYETLLDLHHAWELELERYQEIEKRIKNAETGIGRAELLQVFATYLGYIPERNRERVLQLKEVRTEDFCFAPALSYHGNHLEQEVQKILRTLMLCTTWRTHWMHELMVQQARRRGDTENDVIRDIFLKNRTMSLVRDFEGEGFHVMKVQNDYHLILASNFEYNQDLDRLQIGPGALNYTQKEILARQFMSYLEQINPTLHGRIRIVQGEPPLGQGHARIVSIGLSIPQDVFDLTCRYLRTFLDQTRQGCTLDLQSRIPPGELTELYHLDPFFAPYPELKVMQEVVGTVATGDCLLSFGECAFGEFEGSFYGKEAYDELIAQVEGFERHLAGSGRSIPLRPWQFEVDPYRRHSVIGAVGIRFDKKHLGEVLDALKGFLGSEQPSF